MASPVHSNPAGPPEIRDYEYLRPIGRGAYGEVWLARNLAGSFVALKVVARAAFDHDRPFDREFEGIKRFEPISRSDPAQVAIFHVGRGDGFFYYVMELADPALSAKGRPSGADKAACGQLCAKDSLDPESYSPLSLKRLLDDRGALPLDECIGIALSLTRALAHLHAHGLVHRDVKPSNVIFVNGMAKLADIGLVTAVDATRSFVGTEGYLAPEGPGTKAGDVYSLGKMLYEMSTGCHRGEFPTLPPDFATRPDRDRLAELNAIVVRACQTDPHARYPDAPTMGAELEILRRGHSVRRRRSWRRRGIILRNMAMAAGTAAMALTFFHRLVTTKELDFVHSKNAEANAEYNEGIRLLHNDGTWMEAAKHFESAIGKDSEFSEAYSHLAAAWVVAGDAAPGEGGNLARAAALKAIALNPHSSFGHAILASIRILFDLDWAGAERERRRAVELLRRGGVGSPAEIFLESAINLAVMGKRDDALAMLDRALAAPDPMTHWRLWLTGCTYEGCRKYDEAIQYYEKYIQAVPGYRAATLEDEARASLGKNDLASVIRLERQAALERGEDATTVNRRFTQLKRAFEERGPDGFWEARLELEKARTDRRHFMRMAAIYARLRRSDDALRFLELARRETPTVFASDINKDPGLDALRSEPRFQTILDGLWKQP